MHEAAALKPRPYDPPVPQEIGPLLVVVGLVVVGVGLLLMLGLPLGRLPGDIVIGGERGGIFIPLATSILLSIALTVLLNLIVRR